MSALRAESALRTENVLRAEPALRSESAPRTENVLRAERSANDSYPSTADMEAEIREFVRKDLESPRRPESGGGGGSSGEVFVSNLNSIVQRVAGTSVAEIDNLIAELELLREYLQQEGQRVQREVVAYAQISQAAMRSTKIIVESIAHMKEKERLR
jgi:hypothetical protein